MKFKRRAKFNMKRTFSIIFLFLVMIGITFGYAFLTTKLEVNGSLEVSSSTWDIHFANIVTESGSVTPTTEPAVSNKTTINFSVELEKATDFYGFTADIVNDGTYDAKLDSIEILPELTTAQQEYFSYAVTYSDGVEIKKDDALDSGTSENIKVRFEYKENVDTSKYPEEDVEFNFTVTMNYVQGKGNEVDHSITVYTANMWDRNEATTEDGTSTSVIWIGQAIPNGITTYQTPEQAMAAFKQASGNQDRPYFVKHTVADNTVTESYVGFVITPEMAQASPGMTAGTYYLKGKKTMELVGGSWQCMSEYDDGNGNCIDPDYNINKATILSAFGSSYCKDLSFEGYPYFGCSRSSFGVYVYPNGSLEAGNGSWGCGMDDYGYSGCYGW